MSHDTAIMAAKSAVVGVVVGTATHVWALAEPLIAQATSDPSTVHALLEKSVTVGVVGFVLWWLVEQNRAARNDAKEAADLASKEKVEALKIASKEKSEALASRVERETYYRQQVNTLQQQLVAMARQSNECIVRNVDVLSDAVRQQQIPIEGNFTTSRQDSPNQELDQ
jgi:hypothetical protein